jgi:hypothetical protein
MTTLKKLIKDILVKIQILLISIIILSMALYKLSELDESKKELDYAEREYQRVVQQSKKWRANWKEKQEQEQYMKLEKEKSNKILNNEKYLNDSKENIVFKEQIKLL